MIGNFNGEVNIIPLLVNGEIPQQEMLTLIDETVNNKKVRPLTDKVLIKKTTIVNYDIELKYYISRENESMATSIQEKIEKAIDSFVLWQKSKLGRDSFRINIKDNHGRCQTSGNYFTSIYKNRTYANCNTPKQ